MQKMRIIENQIICLIDYAIIFPFHASIVITTTSSVEIVKNYDVAGHDTKSFFFIIKIYFSKHDIRNIIHKLLMCGRYNFLFLFIVKVGKKILFN